MELDNQITAAGFSAFVKCPTKAYLLAISETAPESYFAALHSRISSTYKAMAAPHLFAGAAGGELCSFEQLRNDQNGEIIVRHVDCETAVYDFGRPSRLGNHSPSLSGVTIPVLFVPWEKPDVSDNVLACFGALALCQFAGTLPSRATLIYGDSHRRKTVKVESYVSRTRQIIDAIEANWRAQKPPTLVLNKHCTVCDFRSRCRGVAIERDDLSLITAMTTKERAKCAAKGIFTIAQLSYGYRPRRRKRGRPDAERSQKSAKCTPSIAKNDHKLKALAIKKSQVHVVGAPSLKFEGIPIFLDIEGIPDRDFYYLIGLRFECGGVVVERSFWADRTDAERQIWGHCLQTLKAIQNPQIVSYGAYETRFLRRMKERYAREPGDAEFVDQLIKSSVNLIGCIYGKVYFPTFSNNLKEVARYLGFDWTWAQASGAAALLLRRAWELNADDEIKRELLGYNIADCRAAVIVADALDRICGGGASSLDAVNTRSLEVGFQRTFGKLDCALPEFKKINDAAYWDYQRSKVYARTDKAVRQSVRQTRGRRQQLAVEKELSVEGIPASCPRCQSTRFWSHRNDSQVVIDLMFTRRGIKRWAIRYRYKAYRCSGCRLEITPYARRAKFGPNLLAFIVYLLIELRLSHQKAAEHSSSLFDLSLTKTNVTRIKSSMAEKYSPTYRGILRQIAKGSLIHADETKGVVRGEGNYIWVFANLTTVAYVYTESREGTILDEILNDFTGVLVSDFYTAYDSVPCPQQKCLIHLMRDINEDLHRNPFDDDLKDIAQRFGSLLRHIVATIDAYGLKARQLSKHKKAAVEFVEHVISMKCATEASATLRKRVDKNRDRLFTFLDYDGVPWNNNNAEHAVRAFTRLRNVIGTSTPKGHREYATLLSIQQTLHYRGLGFLDFLRSGKMEIDG